MPLLKKLGRVSQLNGTADILINEDSAAVNYYLQRGDSGKVLFIEQDDDQIEIYLPTASDAGAGWHMNFIITAVPPSSAAVIQIHKNTNDSNNIHGVINVWDDDGNASDGTAKDDISFDNTTKIGDRVEIFCDGTKFYCYGDAATVGAVEFG